MHWKATLRLMRIMAVDVDEAQLVSEETIELQVPGEEITLLVKLSPQMRD
jgi:hypothetical protein